MSAAEQFCSALSQMGRSTTAAAAFNSRSNVRYAPKAADLLHPRNDAIGQQATLPIRGSWRKRKIASRRPRENSKACREHRRILENLRIMRTDDAADTRFNAALENCTFYISPMYEFSHGLAAAVSPSLMNIDQAARAGTANGGVPSLNALLIILRSSGVS